MKNKFCYIKYPRTYHVPWSNPTTDDKVLKDLSSFFGKEVVVTEKMDGENTTIYRDYFHARSLEKATGNDRAEVMKTWSRIGQDIPEGWRVCAENLLVKHSIGYQNLTDYIQVFSIWNSDNNCLDWDDTEEWCSILDLNTVPVLYRGQYDESKIRDLFKEGTEGYVIRLADSFGFDSFRKSVVKFVRPNHVVSNEHWRHSKMVRNQLA